MDFNKSNEKQRNRIRQKQWRDSHTSTRKIKQINYREKRTKQKNYLGESTKNFENVSAKIEEQHVENYLWEKNRKIIM